MNEEQLKISFQKIEDNFNAAVISNNIEKIKECVSQDWVIVDAQGGIISQERFFYVIENGMLSHSTMTKEIFRVKIYGNTAVVTGRGKNTGQWQGKPIEVEEWITDIYVKVNEKWLCVLTHLTPVKEVI